MHPGETVDDRFLVEKLAGAGGMGQVFRALDQRTGEPVAVKVLSDAPPEAEARFLREGRLLAGLDHPSIVRYVAHGASPGQQPWLAMEWLDGEDLAARLARGRLSIRDAADLALHVADALAYMHARDVIHRDIKPTNIFLVDGRVDRIKVLDLGIAKWTEGTRITRTGVLMGTPGYMAPELVRGEADLDPRVDVFALGCVLFECLTGAPPFVGAHIVAILTKILFEAAPMVRDVRNVPAGLDELVARMLAKAPDARPPQGLAVVEALHALGELPEREDDAPPRHRPRTGSITSNELRAGAVIVIAAPQDVPGRTVLGPETLDATVERAGTLASTVLVTGDDEIRAAAAEHGGHFERLLDGSGAVLLMGHGVATDMAARAARCALALRALLPDRALAVAMGRGTLTDRSPLGPAIDRAARLVSSGKSDDHPIFLDDVIAGLLDARFLVREGEAGFVLSGENSLGEGTRTLLGKATPCVGRDRELRSLEAMLAACLEERTAQAMLVIAPPGAGKSRLLYEFLRTLESGGDEVAVWVGRGDSLRAGSPFGILGQALRNACDIREGEPPEARRSKIVARVAERVAPPDQRRVSEFLGELMGAPFPDEESLPLRAARRDARLMSDQMSAAFIDFVKAECDGRGLLLVLEDLHWGDRGTVQFVGGALREIGERPFFLLALARPEIHERFPNLWSGRSLHEMPLLRLGSRPSERLVRHALGSKATPELVERLIRLSDGNAFYLEELIRAAAEGRTEDLPETVVAMVQSRLGALDDTSRLLLRAASVFGEVFWLEGVHALVGEAERPTGVSHGIQALVEGELVVRRRDSRFPGEEEYAFRHALLREGAYAMLTAEDQALGHKLAGEWLEQRGEQDALVLAAHFERGGDGARAGGHYLRASEHAAWGGDTIASMAYARRGVDCGVPDELRIRLLGTLCEVVYWQPQAMGEALPSAEELARDAPPGGLPWVQGMFVKMICALQARKSDDFVAALGALMRVEPALEVTSMWVLSLCSAVYLLDLGGRIRDANGIAARVGQVAQGTEERDPVSAALWHLLCTIRNAYAQQDPWSAVHHGDEAVAMFQRIGHQRYRDLSLFSVGMKRWFLGAYDDAEADFARVRVPDEELGYGSSVRSFVRAWMCMERGAFDDARGWANKLVASGRAVSRKGDEGRGLWALAEVERRAGEHKAAEAAIQEALSILSVALPLDRPGALLTLSALRLAEGRVEEALGLVEEVIAAAEAIGVCSLFCRDALMRLVHADCLEALGRRDEARATLLVARAWIEAVAEKVGNTGYRQSWLEAVPQNRQILARTSG